jgi:hypothetical protein
MSGMVGGPGSVGPAWTRGEIEAPAGEKNMGTWTAAVYTEEQQARLGVTEMGEPLAAAPATAVADAAAAAEPKTEWAELVGLDGAEAVEAIKKERADLASVSTFPEGGMMTMDWREDRVRVFVDAAGKVSQPPRVG